MSFKNLFQKKNFSEENQSLQNTKLKRVLSVTDLTLLGIAAIIGAGSFSSLGQAVSNGGPGVVLLFIFCGIACGFTAFCYSEFASRIPVSGSAYTYAYASFGELFAWIIGWALLMEYSIGNIYLAFAWSDYFTSLLSFFDVHLPSYFTCSYLEAKKFAVEYSQNNSIKITKNQIELLNAWNNSPIFFGIKFIIDIPALTINFLITALVYVGVKESKNISNIMVYAKLSIVFIIIIISGVLIFKNDLFHNWTPDNSQGIPSFLPNGLSGVMSAVSGVFFAYIGFDAISVMAEESKNPQRDLPRGMIYSLVICTIIYIGLTLVLTGAVNYKLFNGIGDPLAFIFEKENLNIPIMHLTVASIAVVAMTGVLLVFQMGQPRIWMTMSRDGLLPKSFQKIHPKYKTPSFATIITGLVVGLPVIFTDKSFVLDFTSIGTLFAFVIVCGGVLVIPRRKKEKGKFHLPYINAKYILPISLIIIYIYLGFFLKNGINKSYFQELLDGNFIDYSSESLHSNNLFFTGISVKVSTIIFWIILTIISIITFIKKLSLIPLLGLISCLYLLTGMTLDNWKWFGIWFLIGLFFYFIYGFKNSVLRKNKSNL